MRCVRKQRGVRMARWKLTHFREAPDEWALYDLQQDPDELHNLVDRPGHADLVACLRDRIEALRATTDDVDPTGYVAPRLEPGKCPV